MEDRENDPVLLSSDSGESVSIVSIESSPRLPSVKPHSSAAERFTDSEISNNSKVSLQTKRSKGGIQNKPPKSLNLNNTLRSDNSLISPSEISRHSHNSESSFRLPLFTEDEKESSISNDNSSCSFIKSPKLTNKSTSKNSERKQSSLQFILPILSENQTKPERSDLRDLPNTRGKKSCLEISSPEILSESDSDTFSLPPDKELNSVIYDLNSTSDEDSDDSQQLHLQPQSEDIYKLVKSLKPNYKLWKKVNVSSMASSSECESPKRKKFKKNPEHLDMGETNIGINLAGSFDLTAKKHKKSKKSRETLKYGDQTEENVDGYKKKTLNPNEIGEPYSENIKKDVGKKKKHKLPHMLPSEDELDDSINNSSEIDESIHSNVTSPIRTSKDNKNSVEKRTLKSKKDIKHREESKKPKAHTMSSDDEPDSSAKETLESNTSDNINSLVKSHKSYRSPISAPVDTLSESENEGSDLENIQKRGSNFLENPRKISNEKSLNSTKSEKYREHKFTESDNEDISRYSSLLKEKLVEHNNIWILQCPVDMDVSQLLNQELDFNGVSKLSAKKGTYEAYSYKHDEPRVTTLAVPSHRNRLKVCNIPVTGNIIISESIDQPKTSSFRLPEVPDRVAFPTDELRPRHPLLGRCISDSSESGSLLHDSMNSSYQARRKHKQKHKRKEAETKARSFMSNDDSLGDNTINVNSTSLQGISPKKKKKRKNEDEEINGDATDDNTSLEAFSPKKKKKKHKNEDEESGATLESEGHVERKKEKKKKKKRDDGSS